MIFLVLLSWVAVVVILAAYALGGMHRFSWANAIFAVPLALPALIAGAYASATINLAFGAIGIYHVAKRRRELAAA